MARRRGRERRLAGHADQHQPGDHRVQRPSAPAWHGRLSSSRGHRRLPAPLRGPLRPAGRRAIRHARVAGGAPRQRRRVGGRIERGRRHVAYRAIRPGRDCRRPPSPAGRTARRRTSGVSRRRRPAPVGRGPGGRSAGAACGCWSPATTPAPWKSPASWRSGAPARWRFAARRHRYVFQRMLTGVPMDHRCFTRYLGLAWQAMPPAVISAWLKALLLQTTGAPGQFGAPVHDDDLLTAGFTHSPFYLQLVAEGRIATRPWISRVDGATVHYTDGRHDDVDAIVLCTGFVMDLPCLGPRVRAALRPDDLDVDLYQHTFHPSLPGFACMGILEHSGPDFPTLEQQRDASPRGGSGAGADATAAAWPAASRPRDAARHPAHRARAHRGAGIAREQASSRTSPRGRTWRGRCSTDRCRRRRSASTGTTGSPTPAIASSSTPRRSGRCRTCLLRPERAELRATAAPVHGDGGVPSRRRAGAERECRRPPPGTAATPPGS